MKKTLVWPVVFLFAAMAANAQTQDPDAAATVNRTANASPSPSNRSPESAEADRLNAQVVKLYGEGKYDEALEPARRVLEMRERAPAPDEAGVAVAHTNLASIYLRKGKEGEAETHYQRALAIYEKNPSDAQKAAGILDSLAYLSYRRDESDKAGKYLQRSVDVREKALGAEHAEVATALVNLAEFHQLKMNYAKAEPLYQRALAIMDKVHDPLRPEVRQAAFNYACLLHRKDRAAEAKEVELRYWRAAGETTIDPDEVFDGKALSKPQPRYPDEAKPRGVQGTVGVRILVDGSGSVIRACAVNGPPLLRPGSEQAAYGARFSPTLLRGKPVWVTGIITYRYVLQ